LTVQNEVPRIADPDVAARKIVDHAALAAIFPHALVPLELAIMAHFWFRGLGLLRAVSLLLMRRLRLLIGRGLLGSRSTGEVDAR